MKDAGRELGRIDILVNNAANYETAEFEKLTVRQWDAIFASNTRGPFLVSREALKWMRRKRGKGRADRSQDHQHGITGRAPAVGDACTLLFVESCSTHADESHGKGAGAGDRCECGCSGDDRTGGKSCGQLSCGKWRNRLQCCETDAETRSAEAVLFFATAPQFITGQILAVDGGLGL